jgi:predicted outer membrane repeat protein
MRSLIKITSLFLAAGLVAVSSTSATAAIITVTTSADTIAADGVTSLREAVEEANTNGSDDTIVLVAATTYVLNHCVSGALAHNESSAITIEGNGAVIQQTCIDEPIFVKTDATDQVAELQDLTLVSGPNSGVLVPGATINATSQLILNGVTIDGADAGGASAILVDFGTPDIDLTVIDSSITNTVGSAISSSNPVGVEVINSTISDNSGNGLGLTDGTPTIVTDSFIERNGASGIVVSGQGFGQQPEVTITNTTISDNDDAGFYCLSSCRTLIVENSTISNNGTDLSPQRGGAITMPIVLQGGVLPSVTITGSTFIGNRADHPGGAVFVFGSFDSSGPDQPIINVSNSIFDDNAPTCANCDGGAISVSVGKLNIENTSITNNNAPGSGGAIAISRGDTQEIDEASNLTITDSTLTGNTSGDNGGAVISQVDTAFIIDSTFSSNSATNNGGALSAGGVFNDTLLVSGQTTITGSTFNGNSASNGGAIQLSFPDGSRVDVTNSTIHDNSAFNAGGGFFVGTTELLDLEHVTVSANSAPDGANIGASGPVNYNRSIIDEPLGGGANCEPIPGAPVFVIPNFVSDGFNVISDLSCPDITSDIAGPTIDPMLGSLSDNGGPTLTQLPGNTGDAIGVVPVFDCSISTDQRGESRPLGFGCEAGAVEIDDEVPALPAGFPGQISANTLVLNGMFNSERFEISDYSSLAIRVDYDEDLSDAGNSILTGFFDRSEFNNLRVRSRGGDDEISIVSINLTGLVDLRSGGGADSVEVFTSNFGRLQTNLGTGGDTFLFSGGVVSGRTSINTSSGADVVTLAELSVNGRSTVSLGSGSDQLRIFVSSFERFTARGNAGSDTVDLNDSEFAQTKLIGGSGNDGLSTTDNTFSSLLIRSFEF